MGLPVHNVANWTLVEVSWDLHLGLTVVSSVFPFFKLNIPFLTEVNYFETYVLLFELNALAPNIADGQRV